MAEQNKNERTIKEIITDATDRQMSEYYEPTITPEELIALVAKRDNRKKKRVLKVAGIAALFIIAVVGAVMVFNSLTLDVGANKNEKEEIITEDGVVIEDGGYGASEEDVWTSTDWDDVEIAKMRFEDLMVPKYYPNGYKFKKLTVESLEGGHIACLYLFENDKNEKIEISQFIQKNNLNFFKVDERQKVITSEKGKIYITDEEIRKATIQIDGSIIIDIWCKLDDNEIVKIIENMQY